MDIRVIENYYDCDQFLRAIKRHCDDFKILGFDCEWEFGHEGRRPVSLLQLSSYHGLCGLIRLHKLEAIPNELTKILGDSKIIKVGVNPMVDVKNLYDDYHIRVAGAYDLRFMAQKAGCEPEGLKEMANRHLNARLEKPDYRFHSHWEDPSLDQEHVRYAADDAYQSIALFQFFTKKLEGQTFFESKSAYIQRIINSHCLMDLEKKFGSTRGGHEQQPRLQQQREESSGGVGLLTGALAVGGAALLGFMAYNSTRPRNNNN